MSNPDEVESMARDNEPTVSAIVTAWCLEGDASVLLPQLRRRLQPPNVAADSASGTVDAVAHTERNEATIAKRLAAAVVRKIRAETGAGASMPPRGAETAIASTNVATARAALKLDDKHGSPHSMIDSEHQRSPRDGDDQHESDFNSTTLFTICPPRTTHADSDGMELMSATHAAAPNVADQLTLVSVSDLPAQLTPAPSHHLQHQSFTPAAVDLAAACSANSSIAHQPLDASLIFDPGATMPPSASPSHLLFSVNESKVRKELTRALTDACRALLSTSRELVCVTKESAAMAARAQHVEAELAATKSRAARLELELLHAQLKQHDCRPSPRDNTRQHRFSDTRSKRTMAPTHSSQSGADVDVGPHTAPAMDPTGEAARSQPAPSRCSSPSSSLTSEGVPCFRTDTPFEKCLARPPAEGTEDAFASYRRQGSRERRSGNDVFVDTRFRAAHADHLDFPAFPETTPHENNSRIATPSDALRSRPLAESGSTFDGEASYRTWMPSLRGMANVVRGLAHHHPNHRRDSQQALAMDPTRCVRPLSADRNATCAHPPHSSDPAVSPTVHSPLTAKGSGIFPSSARGNPVRMQLRAEESIDDIGMPMLNQYVILSELGAGCQGTVNLALDTETEELRAIKVIARPIATSGVGARKQRENAAKLAQLQREIAIMKRCRHRNVVALFEVIDDPEADSMYLVMQYVEKGSVAKQTDNGETTPIDGATLASYAKQLCSGLQYLHSRGIVHRDVKPENLLLGANGVVYLSDFGISSVDETSGVMTPRVSSASADATAAQQHHCSGGGLTEALRHSPSTRGTIAFLAPEVLSSETTARFTYSPCTPLEEHHDDSRAPVDNVLCARETLLKGIPPDTCSDATTLEKKQVDGCAADVWALGMSLYVMLYGQLPWPATNAADYMDHVTSADAAIPYPAATRDGHVITEHEEWRSLLSRMICRDVKQRMTAAEAHEAAKRLVHKYSDSDATAPVVAVDDVEHAITVLRRPAQH